jgi:hypothetical protein
LTIAYNLPPFVAIVCPVGPLGLRGIHFGILAILNRLQIPGKPIASFRLHERQAHALFRLQLLYVYVCRAESGGRLFNVAANRILACCVFMTLLMVLSEQSGQGFRSLTWR